MKKILCIILCLSMLLFAACGAQKSDPAADAKAAYESFLKGDRKTVFFSSADDRREFTVKELGDALCKDLIREGNDVFISDVQYAYIDCGLDGVPELAVDYHVTQQYLDNYPDTAIQHYVIRLAGDELEALWYGETYYRTATTINQAGYITSGGSYSAMGHFYEFSLLDKNCDMQFLYSADYEMGHSEPLISRFNIDYLELPDEYQHDNDFEGDYEVDTYNFTKYMYDDDYSYAEYRANNMYVFLDAKGEQAEVPEPWASFYKEKGIKVYTQNEMQDLITNYLKEVGVGDDIRNAAVPEWKSLEYDWIREAVIPSFEAKYSREYLLDEWYLEGIYSGYDVITPSNTEGLDATVSFIKGPDVPLAYFTYNNPTDARGAYLLTEMPVYDSDGLEYPAEGELHVEFMPEAMGKEVSKFTANIDHDDGSLWVDWMWWPEGMEAGDPDIKTMHFVKAVG